MIHPDLIGVRTLVFDMDGTLTRSGEMAITALRRGMTRFYEKRGATPPDYSDEELVAGIGAPSGEFYKSLLDDEFRGEWSEFRDLIHDEERRYLRHNRVTYPGTAATLTLLRRRGYRTALVSNCNTPYLHAMTETQNLVRHFDRMLCIGDREGATKTSLIAEVVDDLGGPAAVIGDRHYDVEGALANGLPAVGALYGYGPREELRETATWVDDIRELRFLFWPLRELAERIANRINTLRPLDRPFVVGLSAPHETLSKPLSRLLITELTDRNVPASYLDLERHATPSNSRTPWRALADRYPWERLERDVLAARHEGRIDTHLPQGDQLHPYRGRPGSVLLVEGRFLGHAPLREEQFDLRVDMRATPAGTVRAIRGWSRREQQRARDLGDSVLDARRTAAKSVERALRQWKGREGDVIRALLDEPPRRKADMVVDGDRLDRGVLLES